MFWLNSAVASLLMLPAITDGGSVRLAWAPNRETDLAGYRIYHGTRSRVYDRVIDVGKITSFRVKDLQPSVRYYFAVTAYDDAGNESNFSEEVTAVVQSGEAMASSSLLTHLYTFPNPFTRGKGSAVIHYELTQPTEVTIEILDIQFKLIKRLMHDVRKSAGEHTETVWDGTNAKNEPVANGVYYCRIVAGGTIYFTKIAVTH